MPCRAIIWLWRYKGRWSAYLLTSTWARRPGPGRPRSIGREGNGAWTKRSQQAQAKRGRTMRFTMKRPGTYSSSSVVSAPIRRSLPPQSAQASAPGVSSTSIRGMWSGIGRRFGRPFSSMSGRRIRAVIAAAAISLVSSASCSCSAVSAEAPKRYARCPASWWRSFSISTACVRTSASSRAVKTRSSSGSSGRIAVSSSMQEA